MAERGEVQAGPGGSGQSTVWTIALATALIGMVALPRRRGGNPAEASPNGPAREASPSHSGADAKRVADSEPERGRKAQTPSEIPAKGWKDIGMRVFRDVSENRIVSVAAGVTFYALLAIFPAIAALVSCYGLVADASTINHQIASLQGIVPSGALDIIGEQVKRINEKGGTTLGLTFFTGLLLSIWSANGGMKAVFDALTSSTRRRKSATSSG